MQLKKYTYLELVSQHATVTYCLHHETPLATWNPTEAWFSYVKNQTLHRELVIVLFAACNLTVKTKLAADQKAKAKHICSNYQKSIILESTKPNNREILPHLILSWEDDTFHFAQQSRLGIYDIINESETKTSQSSINPGPKQDNQNIQGN